MQKRNKKFNSGFSLLELLIALAILAIIAAILIPNFFATTERARLRSDIQSARVIQNAIELYTVERNREPEGASIESMVEYLAESGFLRARYASIQTEDATWESDAQRGVVVNIQSSPEGVHNAYGNLSASEQLYVINGRRGS
ncbi:MAG: prepilin-type N-terminal cleavage/methylation domain-containing protein [Defluviitaleaceae bacterium]|nr:prepilin-type N-terminal cleavage/methylation domain-containing protein [Defluviitaleaceae bacterium]